MGVSEHASGVAKSAIEALKASPALLALIFLQLTTLAMIYFSVENAQARWHERQMALITKCFGKVN